jgi:prephenate dehydrogenase
MERIDKLVVVGVGLIGGSFALALKEAGAVRRVVGVGRSAANIYRAQELRIIDAPGEFDRETFGDADRTKQDVVDLAKRELKRTLARFVPGHPIAGTEKSGAEAAFAKLYRGRKVVLTPLKGTDRAALTRVRGAWTACGASVFELTPREHDAVLATISHLPHVLAFALVDQVARHRDAKRLFSYAAGGFRDFTRIASSSPEMWRDICMANRKALLAELGRYEGELARLRKLLERGDGTGLEALFAGARDARDRWIKDGQ